MIFTICVLLGAVAVIGSEMDAGVIVVVVLAVAAVGVMMSGGRRDNEAVEHMLDWWSKNGK